MVRQQMHEAFHRSVSLMEQMPPTTIHNGFHVTTPIFVVFSSSKRFFFFFFSSPSQRNGMTKDRGLFTYVCVCVLDVCLVDVWNDFKRISADFVFAIRRSKKNHGFNCSLESILDRARREEFYLHNTFAKLSSRDVMEGEALEPKANSTFELSHQFGVQAAQSETRKRSFEEQMCQRNVMRVDRWTSWQTEGSEIPSDTFSLSHKTCFQQRRSSSPWRTSNANRS